MIKLPKIDQPDKYVGLYVVDFGDHCALGYTADEVAVLLESEQFADVKIYKIHRATSAGEIDLAGVTHDRFQLESGLFFHAFDEAGARADYQSLLNWSEQDSPPCRAKLQIALSSDQMVLVALIFPAECEEEMGRWLAASGFTGSGAVDAGVSQIAHYHGSKPEIIESRQLWPDVTLAARSRKTLLAAVGMVLQR